MFTQLQTAGASRLRSRPATAAIVSSLAFAVAALPRPASADAPTEPDFRQAQTFACGTAGKMKTLFTSDSGELTAFVQWPGDPVRTLRILPPTGEPNVAWSDGNRSLVWNAGVKLTWRDGATGKPVSCGRDNAHVHEAPQEPSRHVHTTPRGT